MLSESAIRSINLQQIHIVDQYSAKARRIKAAQKSQQCCFANPAWACDRNHLACLVLALDTTEYGLLALPVAKRKALHRYLPTKLPEKRTRRPHISFTPYLHEPVNLLKGLKCLF